MVTQLHDLQEALLLSTQRSQSLVIAAVDRLAGGRGRLSPLGRVWRFSVEASGRLVDNPLQLLDQAYDTSGRLLALHREFLHRMVETVDTRDDSRGGDRHADVVPISRYR